MKTKKWTPPRPTECQICREPEAIATNFIDGRMNGSTTWGIMCSRCHATFGVGLGLGKGQKYDTQTLTKIGG